MTVRLFSVLVAATLVPAIPLSAQDEDKGWAFNMRTAVEMELPERIRSNHELSVLEYDGDQAGYRGLRVDLNRDNTPDYIVASSPSLCGNGGCNYLLFDGADFRVVGLLFGNPVFGRAIWINGYRVINVYGRMNADSGRYATYVFDGESYVNVSTVTLSGEDLHVLFEELREIPILPKGGLR